MKNLNKPISPYRYYKHIDIRTSYVIDKNGYIWVQLEKNLQSVGLESGLIYIVMVDGYEAYENVKQYISEHLNPKLEKKLDIFLKGNEKYLREDNEKDFFMSENNFKEKVSKLCHDQWSNWMKYLFSKSTEMFAGGRYLPQPTVERWKRQIDTDYEKLSKEEQDSDRKEADKFIALFNEENKKIIDILSQIENKSCIDKIRKKDYKTDTDGFITSLANRLNSISELSGKALDLFIDKRKGDYNEI